MFSHEREEAASASEQPMRALGIMDRAVVFYFDVFTQIGSGRRRRRELGVQAGSSLYFACG